MGRSRFAFKTSRPADRQCSSLIASPLPLTRYLSQGERMEYAPNHRPAAGRARLRAAVPRHPSPLAMQAMAVEFPQVHGHPNRLPFEGVLTLVDVPSDRAPSGARGHRVILTRAAAEAALPSLLGMAVDYKPGFDGHDARQKCGIITAAELDGRRLTVSGFVFARDFPEIEQGMAEHAAHGCRSGLAQPAAHAAPLNPCAGNVMGMSYELADAHVLDMSAQIWTLTRATFTGAAILLRDKAAYRDTSFQLRAATKSGAPCSTRRHRVDHGVTASRSSA